MYINIYIIYNIVFYLECHTNTYGHSPQFANVPTSKYLPIQNHTIPTFKNYKKGL